MVWRGRAGALDRVMACSLAVSPSGEGGATPDAPVCGYNDSTPRILIEQEYESQASPVSKRGKSMLGRQFQRLDFLLRF